MKEQPNMSKTAAALGVAFIVSMVASSAFAQEPASSDRQKKTYALVIANNGSVDEGVEPLRFADDDGARFYEMFSDVADDATLLTTLDADSQKIFTGLAAKTREPSRANLERAVESMRGRLEADRQAGIQTEVYLIFTGHGNVDETGEGYLSLTDGKLRRSDLYRDVIRPLDADFTHLIVDACHAYFMVRARGGGSDWKDDRSGQTLDDELKAFVEQNKGRQQTMQRVGVILSTSGTAEVHEWSRYRGGVFSHQLRSGLLGAADANGDGAVGYREIEAYLVAANAAVANPKARIRVFAEPPAQDRSRPVVRVSDYDGASLLRVPQGVGGRYHIEDDRGLRYADMNVATAASSTIALINRDDRSYYLRTDSAQAEIPRGEAVVQSPALAFAQVERQPRGSVEEAFRTSLFATPYGPSFVAGFTAGRDTGVTDSYEGPSDSADDEREWHLSAELAVGSPVAVVPDHGAPQLQVSLGAGWDGPVQTRLGLYADYGFSSDEFATNQRVGAGLELAWFGLQAGALSIAPRARFGPQAFFVEASDDTLRADPIGLRLDGAVLLGWTLSSELTVSLALGLGADFVTTAGVESNDEELFITPYAGLGLRY